MKLAWLLQLAGCWRLFVLYLTTFTNRWKNVIWLQGLAGFDLLFTCVLALIGQEFLAFFLLLNFLLAEFDMSARSFWTEFSFANWTLDHGVFEYWFISWNKDLFIVSW